MYFQGRQVDEYDENCSQLNKGCYNKQFQKYNHNREKMPPNIIMYTGK